MKNNECNVHFRCSDREFLSLKQAASNNKLSVSETIRRCLQYSLNEVKSHSYDEELLNKLLRLSADIGRATGMLKQAIAASAYNPRTIAQLVQEYRNLKKQVDSAIAEIAKAEIRK